MSVVHSVISMPTVRGKILFIVNIGLHYDDAADYTESLRKIFTSQLFNDISKQHFVLFRETGAQHFNTSTGEYSRIRSGNFGQFTNEKKKRMMKSLTGVTSPVKNILWKLFDNSSDNNHNYNNLMDPNLRDSLDNFYNTYLGTKCVPITSKQMYDQNWRNRIVYQLLNETDPSGLVGVIPFFNLTAARHDHHLRTVVLFFIVLYYILFFESTLIFGRVTALIFAAG